MDSSITDNNRLAYVDFLKSISIFLVITLHTGLWHINFINDRNTSAVLQYFCRIIAEGVPVFVMINGFLLFPKNFDMNKHIRKIKKIMILLVVWAVIMTLAKTYILGRPISLDWIMKNLITTSISNRYTGVLWFLQSLLALYFVYPFLKYIYDNDKNKYFEYLFLLVSFFTVGLNLFKMVIDWFLINKSLSFLKEILPFFNRFNPIANGSFLLFFMLGGLIKKNLAFIDKHRNAFLLIGLFGQFIPFYYGYSMSIKLNNLWGGSHIYSSIFMPLFITSLFCLALYYDVKQYCISIIRLISENTFGIYFLHTIIIVFIRAVYPFKAKYFINRLVFTFIVFMLSLLISICIQHIPKLKKLISL